MLSLKKILIALAFFGASTPLAFPSVSIKVTGGMGFLFRNDYNTGGQGIYEYYRSSYGAAAGQFNPLRLGAEFCGEVALAFSKRLAVGLGVGYARYARTSQFGYEWSFFSSAETLKPSIRLVPLTVNIHYYTPMQRRLKTDIYVGAGYYLMTFDHDWDVKTNFFSYETSQTFGSKKGALGFQAGICFEIALTPQVALIVQANGRLVKFAEISGVLKKTGHWFMGDWQEENGSAYFWFFVRDNEFAQILFSPTEPSETEFSVIRKGRLDLSGVSAGIGLKFIF